jgi:uncharacterized protein YgbK (DUF1537 family)
VIRRRAVGFIADDITGATDLASALAARGLDTRLAFGSAAVPSDGGDAIVVALKIRSVPAAEARAAATDAAQALRAVGVEQFFFKYCSTFDSTDEGNIGPIADALIDVTGSSRTVHNPSYPANGRTVYQGHLFVGDQLLSESPMRDHPLNPMHDSRLTRVLGAQTPRPVHLVALPTVGLGAKGVETALAQLDRGSAHHVIADAVRDADVDTLGLATAGDALAAGAAAFGAAFGWAALRRQGHAAGLTVDTRVAVPSGAAAILAGSLSRATREQVRAFAGPTLTLSVTDMVAGEPAVERALAFFDRESQRGAVLIATDPESAPFASGVGAPSPDDVSRRVELVMAQIAAQLEGRGIRRLIVAGGETSGAVADALALRSARLGADISTGVPWIVADDRPLAVAFKSGNFGGPTFFADALQVAGS